MFSNDILDIHVTLSSIMDIIWMKICNEIMISSFLLPHHYLLIKCITNIWLQCFSHKIWVIAYDYSQLCSHLGHLVIDFLVAKNRISCRDFQGLNALNMLKKIWVVSSYEHVNFAINEKYFKTKLWQFELLYFTCDLPNIQKLNFKEYTKLGGSFNYVFTLWS